MTDVLHGDASRPFWKSSSFDRRWTRYFQVPRRALVSMMTDRLVEPRGATAEVERFTHAYRELARRLTAERNARWIPRFRAMLDGPDTTLVIVGLYHMVGGP